MSGFLGRWSRRKRGEDLPEPAAAPPAAAAPASAPVEPEFDLERLPALDSLGAGSDLSSFLHPKVPALLRQAALRRVWAADPVICNFVGPADYAWDFNAPDGVPGFALELGGDVQKLLAQAIGNITAPEEPPPAEAAPPQETPPQEAPVLVAELNPVRLVDAPPPLAIAEEPEPEAESLPVRARRHGGAVPVVESGQVNPPLG